MICTGRFVPRLLTDHNACPGAGVAQERASGNSLGLGCAGLAWNFFQFKGKRFSISFSLFEQKLNHRVCQFRLQFFFGSKRNGFLSHFPLFQMKTKISGAPYCTAAGTVYYKTYTSHRHHWNPTWQAGSQLQHTTLLPAVVSNGWVQLLHGQSHFRRVFPSSQKRLRRWGVLS